MFTAQVSISPDPLVYFFSHSVAFVAVCASVFFILGLLFGKFTWGRYKKQTRLLLQDADTQKNEIVNLKRKLAEMASRSGIPVTVPESENLRGEISGSDPVMRSFLETAAAILPSETQKAEKNVDGYAPVPIPLSKLIAPAATAVPPASTEPGESKTESPGQEAETPPPATSTLVEVKQNASPGVPRPEAEAREAGDLIKAKMDALRALVERGRQLHPPDASPPGAAHSIAADHAATRKPVSDDPSGTTQAASEPRLHSDPYLGLIYTTPPAQSDDLTHLKGVASVIEGKLNEFGVFTFKQIALWDDEHVREFSQRLAFKDRINRERWVEQARELHRQKYGESL
jgi:predicted flap endonuclease-1-like 5' DNA nuclease